MDYFQHKYYRLLEAMLTVIGQWPHQSQFHSWAFVVFTLLLGCSVLVPMTTAAVKNRDNLVTVMSAVQVTVAASLLTAKTLCCKWNEQKVFELLNRIHIDWQVWAHDQEINILHEYAEKGRKLQLRLAVTMYVIAMFYMVQPAIPKIMNILLKNGSTPGKFPVPMDYYYFDAQNYYFSSIAHVLVVMMVGFLAAGPFFFLLVVSVHHGCGIFAAVGHKLSAVGKNERVAEKGGESKSNESNVEFEYLAWCIRRHREAIEYADMIESTFTWSFFIAMGLNILLVSLVGYQIVKNTDTLGEVTRLMFGITAGLIHTWIESYMGQILMDHSMGILHSIQSSKWYEQTSKIQYLLYFMMMRCSKTCELTAGKISIMSVETFVRIIKTSMSFLTVLRSM